MATERFTIKAVVFEFTESREKGSTSPPIRTGVKSADIICLVCHQEWTGYRTGPGHLSPAIGGEVHFECPGCRTAHHFDLRRIP